MRSTVHDKRGNHPVGIELEMLGALVGLGCKIDQARLEGHAELNEHLVNCHTRLPGEQ